MISSSFLLADIFIVLSLHPDSREKCDLFRGMRSGKATSLTILSDQLSTLSSASPTHASFEGRMVTSLHEGEWDLSREEGWCGVRPAPNFSSASSFKRWSVDAAGATGVSMQLRVRVKTAPDSGLNSDPMSLTWDASGKTGDRRGDTTRDINGSGSEEYKSNPATPNSDMTSRSLDSLT